MEGMELSKLNEVCFPDMRRNVLSAVRALSDEAYQRRVWILRNYPHEGYYDDFAMNLSILFDDTLVLEDPAARLGTVLKSQEEVEAMQVLALAINVLMEHEGSENSDADYVASPLWGDVVSSASVAYGIMAHSDQY